MYFSGQKYQFRGVQILLVAVAIYMVGCSSEQPAKTSVEHGHHGGHSFVVSGAPGVELEFTLDGKRNRMVVYVQNAENHAPLPLAVEQLEATFTAGGTKIDAVFTSDPRPSAPEGSASRFQLSLDKLPQQLVAANQFDLEIRYHLDGKTFKVTMQHDNDHVHEYHHD